MLDANTSVVVLHALDEPVNERESYIGSAFDLGLQVEGMGIQCESLSAEWAVILDGDCDVARARGAWGTKTSVGTCYVR